jgi:uncharacterized protein (TIRG00374 family)
MGKRLFSMMHYILFLGGGIFLVWWQLKGMTEADKKEFYNALHNANYWLIIPIVIMSMLSHLSRSMRWKLLMEQLGYAPKLKNIFSVTMIGYLANSAVPRLGEILKCTFLAKYENLKVDKLVGTILIERTFDFICYLIFIGITVLIQIDVVGGYVRDKLLAMGQSSGIPMWLKMIMLLGIIFMFIFMLKLLFRTYPENKILNKTKKIIGGIGEGFKSIQHLKKRKMFIAHTLFIWSMYLLQIFLGFQAMEGTSHLSISAACSVLSLATLAMIATPGGIGSFPLFVMETLTIYSIAGPVGKAFGWLIWGVTTSIIIVVGLICLIVLPYINRNNNEISQEYPGQNIE